MKSWGDVELIGEEIEMGRNEETDCTMQLACSSNLN